MNWMNVHEYLDVKGDEIYYESQDPDNKRLATSSDILGATAFVLYSIAEALEQGMKSDD